MLLVAASTWVQEKKQSLTRPRNKQAVVRKPDAEGSDATSHNETSVLLMAGISGVGVVDNH